MTSKRAIFSTSKSVAAVLLSGLVITGGSPPAAFATTGALTIVGSGGAAENSGWSYTSGEITLTTTPVSINASEIVAKMALADLVVSAASIRVDTSIVSSAASRDLTLKATGNIQVLDGITISTQGGDITFQSDSDASGVGSVLLGSTSASSANSTGSIDSNGGRILLSGGLNPLTGFAMASTLLASTKPAGGVAGYGFNVQADGGDIIVRGSSGANSGVTTRAVQFEKNTAGRQIFETSGSGTIQITGDGSSIGFNNPWGFNSSGLTIRTVSGAITLIGKANTAIANARGLAISDTSIISTTGDISIDDTTDGSPANYSGSYVGGGVTDISTGGDIVIRADEYISDGTLTLSGPSATLTSYTGSSFSEARPLGRVNALNLESFVFGQTGNTRDVTINQPITFGGSATFHGRDISIGAALSAASDNCYFFTSRNLTQTAAISCLGLSVSGVGASVTLNNASNAIGTLAGGSSSSRLGQFALTDASGGLTIGQVGSLSGLFSSGVINVATTTGDITLAQLLSSSASSGDGVLLFAHKGAPSGDAGSGDIKVSGSGGLTVESGSRALLYSGSRVTSTGLVSLVGGEENTRSLIASTTVLAGVTPSLGSVGKFALFRTDTPSPTPTPTPTSTPTATPAPNATQSTAPAASAPSSLPAAGAATTLASTGFQNFLVQTLLGVAVVAVTAGAWLLWMRRRLKRVG
jgi:hypothetical protein